MNDEIQAFVQAKVPSAWFTGPPTVEADEEEILVVGALPTEGAVDAFRE